MKRRIGAIFLALMMVISFLPLTIVKAEGSELIINDSQIGNELHQISYSTGWGDSTGYPDPGSCSASPSPVPDRRMNRRRCIY